MLKPKQLDRLNEQIAREAEVSRLYLSISCWAASKGLSGVAKFFRTHHELEEEHMHKLQDYVIATGGRSKVAGVPEPKQDFKSVTEALKLSLKMEVDVSKSINEMVEAFLKEKDYSTFHFLQWYVAEQHEEEFLFRSLIEKAEMIGEDGRGLYWIDKELGAIRGGK